MQHHHRHQMQNRVAKLTVETLLVNGSYMDEIICNGTGAFLKWINRSGGTVRQGSSEESNNLLELL